MSQNLMESCVNNEELQRYVRHFAYKVRLKYPRLMDVEDAENEMWCSVFRAIQNRYDGKTSVFLFAKRAVFSCYGNLTKTRSNAAKLMNEWVEVDVPVTQEDEGFELVEANFTLDQIEQSLRERQERGRQYRYALEVFEYLREGGTLTEYCTTTGISRSYGYKLFSNVIKKQVEQYREGVIPERRGL